MLSMSDFGAGLLPGMGGASPRGSSVAYPPFFSPGWYSPLALAHFGDRGGITGRERPLVVHRSPFL